MSKNNLNETAPPSLRERKKQLARAAILKAAQQLIEQRGFDATRMREIAQLAEVSYQTLYNYFPTKALILQAILTDEIHHVSEEIDAVLQSYRGGLLEALDSINGIRFSIIAEQDRALWRIVTIELFNQTREAAETYQLVDKISHAVLEKLLAQARDSGELMAHTDLRLLADTIFSLGQHSLSNYLLAPHAAPHAAPVADRKSSL
jgi:AcrR family transcriptional regulator